MALDTHAVLEARAVASRIKRVAQIVSLDAKNPMNQVRGNEIMALVDMLDRRLAAELSGPADDNGVA